MAPDVTTTTRFPAAPARATSAASFSMAPVSTPPAAVVTEEEPILTTTVPVPPPADPVVTTACAGRSAGR